MHMLPLFFFMRSKCSESNYKKLTSHDIFAAAACCSHRLIKDNIDGAFIREKTTLKDSYSRYSCFSLL